MSSRRPPHPSAGVPSPGSAGGTRLPVCLPILSTLLALIPACGEDISSAPPSAPRVGQVVVSPSTGELLVGEEVTLTASVLSTSGVPMDITPAWSSSDESVARVSDGGLVEAVGDGTAVVTASAAEVSGSARITVPSPDGAAGTDGATVQDDGGEVEIEIPAGSLEDDVTISVVPADPDELPSDPRMVPGSAWRFGPSGLSFDQPALLELTYDPVSLPEDLPANLLRIHHLENEAWELVPGGEWNEAASSVEAPIDGFSIYALLSIPNTPPSVTIEGSEAISVTTEETVTLNGSGTDPEDGPLPRSALQWHSDVSGSLGAGPTVTLDGLSTGTHRVTLTGTDRNGLSATDRAAIQVELPPNTPPTVEILQPTDGAAFFDDERVTLRAAADDAEEGALTGDALVWSSTVDGSLGTGAELRVSNLSVGEHTISVTVTDSPGADASASVSVQIRRRPANEPPTVTIRSPSDGSVVLLGESVSLDGSATDPEDGALSDRQLEWSSSVDGSLGTGAALSTSDLSSGAHAITLTATDSQGLSSSASVRLEVREPEVQVRTLPSDPTPAVGDTVAVRVELGVGSIPGPIGALTMRIDWNADIASFLGRSVDSSSFDLCTVNEAMAGAGELAAACVSAGGSTDDPLVVLLFAVVVESAGTTAFTPDVLELESVDPETGATTTLHELVVFESEAGTLSQP